MEPDKIRNFLKVFKDHWATLLPASVALIAVTWAFTNIIYSGRVENLREQVNLLKLKNTFLEDKLKKIDHIKTKQQNNSGSTEKFKEKISSLKYPDIHDSKKMTKYDIEKLANFYGLTKTWKTNPHLKMKEGDIYYWYEKGLSEEEIKQEFESRSLTLQYAENKKLLINNQGELSSRAQEIQSKIINKKNMLNVLLFDATGNQKAFDIFSREFRREYPDYLIDAQFNWVEKDQNLMSKSLIFWQGENNEKYAKQLEKRFPKKQNIHDYHSDPMGFFGFSKERDIIIFLGDDWKSLLRGLRK